MKSICKMKSIFVTYMNTTRRTKSKRLRELFAKCMDQKLSETQDARASRGVAKGGQGGAVAPPIIRETIFSKR